MTEVQRARIHLAICQADLYCCRRQSREVYNLAETVFLAALSWVWDAQERAKYTVTGTGP